MAPPTLHLLEQPLEKVRIDSRRMEKGESEARRGPFWGGGVVMEWSWLGSSGLASAILSLPKPECPTQACLDLYLLFSNGIIWYKGKYIQPALKMSCKQ